MTTGWVVLADDRTGALETAGQCAAVGMTTWAGPASGLDDDAWRGGSGADCLVVDLATRHLAPHGARAAVAAAPRGSHRSSLKLDSLLRGNWATEAVALGAGRRCLVVAAFPAAGRVCRDGVVYAGGDPVTVVTATDPRGAVPSARPVDHLRRAGMVDVTSLDGPHAVADWLAAGTTAFGVADATTDAEVIAIARAVADTPEVVLAGTAGAIGALAAAHTGRAPALGGPPLPHPVLVVSASRHPVTRRQLRALTRAGTGTPLATIVAPPATAGTSPDTIAREVAQAARAHLVRHHPATIVIVGGDTAAALLGDALVPVRGLLEPGIPWATLSIDGVDLTLCTKPGAFGDDHTLVRLLGGPTQEETR